jgi:uncharacterized protein (TIGR03437 family)
MSRTRFGLILSLAVLAALPASAQILSNETLNGTYHFRYLGALTSPANSARSFQGTLTFDGKGAYTVSGQGATGASGTLQTRTSGTYYVGPGGLFYMTNPLDTTGNTRVFGGVGAGNVVVASSTDTSFVDIMVAFPASTSASNSSLSGSYHVASLEFAGGNFSQSRDTFFRMSANGSGGLGDVTIKGTSQSLRNAATTQTSQAATYTVSANGSGTMNLPAPAGQTAANTLLAGNKTLFVSADGNLFVAGTATGFDLVVGVKAYSGGAPNSALSGLYFSGLLQNYVGGNPAIQLYAGGGSSNFLANQGTELYHQRTNNRGVYSYDSTSAFESALDADGTSTGSTAIYGLGADGNVLLGAGAGTNYQFAIYVKAAQVGGTGVFLHPQAIVNAASNVPFTAQVSPGEYVTIYGSGLAAGTVIADAMPFPTTLGGVEVTINGTPAPLYYVTPGKIALIVPYSVPDGLFLQFQVNNNGTKSNIAEAWPGPTSPGIFTLTQDGLGDGAITHADFTVVNSASPAKPGETVLVYVTGLGELLTPVAAGSAAPGNPPAETAILPAVDIDGLEATVQFAGLTPGQPTLYQLNVTIPAGVQAGLVPIDILTGREASDGSIIVDAYNYQAFIRIAR